MSNALSYDEKIAELEKELEGPVAVELEVVGDWTRRISVAVKFGKSKKDGHAVITNADINELKKAAVEHAKKKRQRVLSEITTMKQRAKAMKSILEKKGDMTFLDFASIYVKHVEGYEIVPGFELVPQGANRRYRRYGFQSDKLYAALEASKLVGWDRANEPKPTKPGALGTKKLNELTPEDCFLRTVEDKYGAKHRVPNDTSLHSWVRKVLGAAVMVGVIDENPASLKIPKEKTTVAVKAASSELLGDSE